MTEPITRELTDQQMAMRLIERMDKCTSLQSIIARLSAVQSAIEMAGMLVTDNILTEAQAIEWIEKTIESWARGPR